MLLAAEHPRPEAFVEGVERAERDCTEQPKLGVLRDDGDGVEEIACGRREARRAREDRVADRRGHGVRSTFEHLADEERVARRLRVQIVRVDRVRRGKRRDCVGRQRLEMNPHDAGSRGEITEDDTQRMRARKLIRPVGDDDKCAELLDATAEKANDIQRRLVGPMRVLDDERDAAARLVDESVEYGARRVALDPHVDEGPERPRRAQPVARARQDPLAELVEKLTHECALADAGVARDENESATPGPRRIERLLEDGEGSVPLEQHHPHGRSVIQAAAQRTLRAGERTNWPDRIAAA